MRASIEEWWLSALLLLSIEGGGPQHISIPLVGAGAREHPRFSMIELGIGIDERDGLHVIGLQIGLHAGLRKIWQRAADACRAMRCIDEAGVLAGECAHACRQR